MASTASAIAPMNFPMVPASEIEVDTDSYLSGEPVESDGTPWTSWDYSITSYSEDAEVTTEAVYVPIDPVTIDGETFDLWFLDQAQDELIYASEYKLRVVFPDVPSGGPPGERRPYSATVTLAWDVEAGDFDEAQDRLILRPLDLRLGRAVIAGRPGYDDEVNWLGSMAMNVAVDRVST